MTDPAQTHDGQSRTRDAACADGSGPAPGDQGGTSSVPIYLMLAGIVAIGIVSGIRWLRSLDRLRLR
jgi:hypothetical protein